MPLSLRWSRVSPDTFQEGPRSTWNKEVRSLTDPSDVTSGQYLWSGFLVRHTDLWYIKSVSIMLKRWMVS